MITYEQAIINLQKAQEVYNKTAIKLHAAERDLENAKKNLDIECGECNKSTKVKEIELIVERSNGWVSYSNNYDGDWHYSTRKYWVCPHCKTLRSPPSEIDGPFAKKSNFDYDFEHYVKVVHEWDRDHQCCYGRILELLGPHLKREEEKAIKQEKERKIIEAKKLLEEEGLLGNT